METSVNERIKKIIQVKKMNKNSFSKRIEVPPQTIQNIVDGRQNKPSFDVLEKVISSFEDINAQWLLNGEGEMLKSEAPAEAPKEEAKSNELYTVYEKLRYFLIGKGFWEGDTKTVISELFGAKRRVSKHA